MSSTDAQCSKDKSENDTSVITDSQNTDKQSVSSQGKLASEDYRRKSTNNCKSCGKVVWKADICTSCQKENAEPVDATPDRADNQRSSAISPQQSLLSSPDILGDTRLVEVSMHAVPDPSSKCKAQPSMARSIKRKRESLTMFSKKRLKPDLSILTKASLEDVSKIPAMLESTSHAPKQGSSTGTRRTQEQDRREEEEVISFQNVISEVKSARTEAQVSNISSTDEIADHAVEHDDPTLDHTEETPVITEPDTLSDASFGDNDSDAPLARRRPNSRPDQETNHKQDLWSDTTNKSQEADVPPSNPGIEVNEIDDSSDIRPPRRSRPCDCSTKHNKCLHNEQGELDVRRCFVWMSEGHHRKSNRGRQQLQDIAEATQRYFQFCENGDGLDPYSEGARLKYLQHQQSGQAIQGYYITSDAINTSPHPHTRSLNIPDSRLSLRAPDIRYEDVVSESAVEITPSRLIFEVQDDIQELQQQQLTIRNVSRTRHLIFKIILPDFVSMDIKVDPSKGNIEPQSSFTIKVAVALIADKNYCFTELDSKTSTGAELEIGYAYLKGASVDDVGWFQQDFSARRKVTLKCIDLRLSKKRDTTVFQTDASQSTEKMPVTNLPLSKVPAAPLASDTALSSGLQARRNKVGHDFYDLYFYHLHNATAVVDAVLRGMRKDNTLSIIKVIQLAHSRMYHRLVSARSLNKAGFEQLGLRDVRKALEEYAEQHHAEVQTPLESGWTRDGHDVIWKIGKPHTANHLHISSPLPRADQPTERIGSLGMPKVLNSEPLTAVTSTIQDALNESSQRPSIKLILKVPNGPQSFDRQSASTASCNTTSTLPESRTQPPLAAISERLANFPPTPESDRPTPQREGLNNHDVDASDMVDTNNENKNMHVQDVMARMRACGIQFEDANDEDSSDESIILPGQHVSKHITSGVKFTNDSIQLSRITKKQGLKHTARQRLIQDRQRSRNVQMSGNPHEECDKKHAKQPRLTAWVDRKILTDRTADRYAPDTISSKVEKISYRQFLGISGDLETEPCVVRNGKSIQLAFREKQARYGEIGRVRSKRLKGQFWPATVR
ncbi:hypothetical protein LTR64_005379 [Lithohypha guttulata]|uniref:uncharacterized protein n=1 Tax=Lithohypha guttulata TaxID=1690604 RepID=UPI00315DC5F7